MKSQQALNTRKRSEGKHVIPVAYLEFKKKTSPALCLRPLEYFKDAMVFGDYESLGEKSVVRPTFSYLGKYTISDYTIYQLVEHVVLKQEGVCKDRKIQSRKKRERDPLEIELTLYYGYNIPDLFKHLRSHITAEIERITSLNIDAMVLIAKSLIVKPAKSG